MKSHLVVFAKSPRMGRVKSRLAADIGILGAWKFYRRNLQETVRCLEDDPRWLTWIAITPDAARPTITHSTPVYGQGSGDLGTRMHRTMATLPPGPVVIIGTDIPDIRPAHINNAFRALGDHDAVMGPATDGGYWLVGLKRRPRLPDAFSNVRWSGPEALADTLHNLRTRHCSVHLLNEMEDVDDLASYRRWLKNAHH